MSYIHINCLKEWLDSKKVSKEGKNFYSTAWENFTCELCKEKFPESIESNGMRMELINMKLPEFEKGEEYIEENLDREHDHFVVLECISCAAMERRKNAKLIYTIYFKRE